MMLRWVGGYWAVVIGLGRIAGINKKVTARIEACEFETRQTQRVTRLILGLTMTNSKSAA